MSMSRIMRGETGPDAARRLFRIGLLAAALSLLLFFVWLLIWDRQGTARQVQQQIAASWGAAQTVSGPFLLVPYGADTIRKVADADGKLVDAVMTTTGMLRLAPDRLAVEARLDPSVRRRSLYDVTVYTAALQAQARFPHRFPQDLDVEADRVDWEKARVAFAVTDPRGLAGSPVVKIDGRTVDLESGVPGFESAPGLLTAPAGLDGAPDAPVIVDLDLSLKGSERFAVAPTGKRVTTAVNSAWPHPSFQGVLPDRLSVSEDGFAALWRSTHLSSGGALVERIAGKIELGGTPVAAVDLIEPVELYGRLGRAVKYGALFIALTFLSYYLFDLTGRRRVPLFGYALVGLGLVLFFVMLTALAEHLSFLPAYLLAAGALTSLIALYSRAILKSRARAALIGAVIAALYGGLYALLRLEEAALLIGSLVLFAALAVLMYATRGIGDVDAEEIGSA